MNSTGHCKAVCEFLNVAHRKYACSIRRASGILRSHFNINKFNYYKITNNGQFFMFDSCPSLMEDLEPENFLCKNRYYCLPQFHQDGWQISNTHEDPRYFEAEKIKRVISKYRFNQRLSLIVISGSQIQEFGFHSENSDKNQSQFFLNKIKELRLFINWFMKSNSDLFSFLSGNSIDLIEILGSQFYENRIERFNSSVLFRQKFLKAIDASSRSVISDSDQQVLRLILMNRSISEIAGQLYRSKRTIEHRVEKIKLKLNCSSKAELIEKAQELLIFPEHLS